MNKPLTNCDKEDIIRMDAEGISIRKIARMFSQSVRVIYMIIHKDES
tara:strand:+ start:227 stop:367 length:141 start_codon:yes stop_codon:yes gene_type:complete